MTLLIAYVGKKGCVIASDKKRIAFMGNSEKLEDELFSGKIKTNEELFSKANDENVNINITDDGDKIYSVGDALKGEIINKGAFVTKRRRIYCVANGYQIIELEGSTITSQSSGKSGIIIFANKFAKGKANELISKKFKPSLSLEAIGDLFREIIRDVSKLTPTVGENSDALISKKSFTPEEAQKYLNEIVEDDVKELEIYRMKLQDELIKKTKEIELASKIITKGPIGKIVSVNGNNVDVKLNKDTRAFNSNWELISAPGEIVKMVSTSDNPQIGDEVVIENEDLCLLKDKSPLQANVILCSL